MPTPKATAAQLQAALEGVMKLVSAVLGGAKDTPAEGGDTTKPDGKVPLELVDIAAQADAYSKSMDEMRGDLGAFGKSVGGIAVAVITALGYTRFNDIFPFPLGAPSWLGPSTAAAAACGLGATTFLVFRFFFAKRRITFDYPEPPYKNDTADPLRTINLRLYDFFVGGKKPGEPDPAKEPTAPWWRRERRLILQETQPYAESENFKSLWALDDTRTSLLKALHERYRDGKFPKDEADWAQAYRLGQVADLAVWDASAAILERRTRGAFGGPVATVAIILAVGGIGFTFATADWAKGRRTLPEQRVREAQVCVETAKSVTTVPVERDALVQACLSKAKLDLGSTVTTVTVTTPSK